MLLAIDVGNTSTKFGFHDGEAWKLVHSVETKSLFDQAMATALLEELTQKAPPPRFTSISTVVPDMTPILDGALKSLNVSFRYLSAGGVPWLPIRYETAATLGSDRLANALYLHEQGRFPAISVDFGTATKLDVLDSEGAYLGGAILPGVRMMIESLSKGTAQLTEIGIDAPSHAIGRSTKECLQSGTVLALAEAVEGLLHRSLEELDGLAPAKTGAPSSKVKGRAAQTRNPKVSIVATGGLAKVMAPLCPSLQRVEPNLTLEGLVIAARRWSSG